MAVPIHIPKLGMTMTFATLSEWSAGEGDFVEKDSIVLVIETEKVSWEVQATASGYLHILVENGNTADVGAVVGLIAETKDELAVIQNEHPAGDILKEMPDKSDAPLLVEAEIYPEIPPKKASVAQDLEIRPPGGILASPSARRKAKELGVDLSLLSGSGPGGRIVERDVRRYQELDANRQQERDDSRYQDHAPFAALITPLAYEIARQANLDISTISGTGDGGSITKKDVENTIGLRGPEDSAQHVRSIPFTGLRKSIADNMHRSLQTTAQLTTFVEVDMTKFVQFRDEIRMGYQHDETVKISTTAVLVFLVSRVLKHFPIMNSALVGDEIILHNSVNIGIAVDTPEGLMVPVLHNADKKVLLQISKESRDLLEKARHGKLTVKDVTGGTFTLTNVSMFQADGGTPILRPPETCIVNIARFKEKPAFHNGEICVRTMCFVSMTYDHRVVDGAPAHRFLEALVRYLENPYSIMAELR